jgi:hypothetical protein
MVQQARQAVEFMPRTTRLYAPTWSSDLRLVRGSIVRSSLSAQLGARSFGAFSQRHYYWLFILIETEQSLVPACCGLFLFPPFLFLAIFFYLPGSNRLYDQLILVVIVFFRGYLYLSKLSLFHYVSSPLKRVPKSRASARPTTFQALTYPRKQANNASFWFADASNTVRHKHTLISDEYR